MLLVGCVGAQDPLLPARCGDVVAYVYAWDADIDEGEAWEPCGLTFGARVHPFDDGEHWIPVEPEYNNENLWASDIFSISLYIPQDEWALGAVIEGRAVLEATLLNGGGPTWEGTGSIEVLEHDDDAGTISVDGWYVKYELEIPEQEDGTWLTAQAEDWVTLY